MALSFIIYACWLVICALLCFFENNSGTRTVLILAFALPLVMRYFKQGARADSTAKRIIRKNKPGYGLAEKPQSAPGDIREYVPGDPVSRIHWKLSAKTGKLLIRGEAFDSSLENGTVDSPAETEQEFKSDKRHTRLRAVIPLSVVALCALLIFAVPDARNGLFALCNRLFDISEARNAYVYERFSVPAGQGIILVSVLLLTAAAAWTVLVFTAKNRVPALLSALAVAVFQVYFGVSLPAWANIVVFELLCLKLFARNVSRRGWIMCSAVTLAALILAFAFFPGVNANIEALSEHARDRLTRSADASFDELAEAPAAGFETRHVNTRSLLEGDGASQSGKEYRLITAEEKKISIPHTIDYIRAALMALLAVAVIVLPFAPFIFLNKKRKKAREALESADVSAAVKAIFSRVIAWLTIFDLDCGNALFIEWAQSLSESISEDYAHGFARCAELFEEAEYSSHAMPEQARSDLLELLAETEKELYPRAGLRARLRLKYAECFVE